MLNNNNDILYKIYTQLTTLKLSSKKLVFLTFIKKIEALVRKYIFIRKVSKSCFIQLISPPPAHYTISSLLYITVYIFIYLSFSFYQHISLYGSTAVIHPKHC